MRDIYTQLLHIISSLTDAVDDCCWQDPTARYVVEIAREVVDSCSPPFEVVVWAGVMRELDHLRLHSSDEELSRLISLLSHVISVLVRRGAGV